MSAYYRCSKQSKMLQLSTTAWCGGINKATSSRRRVVVLITKNRQLPTNYWQLPTNTIYRQHTRNSEAPTKYRRRLFTYNFPWLSACDSCHRLQCAMSKPPSLTDLQNPSTVTTLGWCVVMSGMVNAWNETSQFGNSQDPFSSRQVMA